MKLTDTIFNHWLQGFDMSEAKARITVKIVDSMDDLQKVLAVRAAVCIGELGWPFNEYMDGNDFTATQLIACVDGEPAGTMRIRYFGGFAKPEWLVVLPRFRNGRFGARGVAFALGSFAFEFCRKKGYDKIYGHAATEVVKLWSKIAGDTVQVLSDPISTGDNKGDLVPMWAEYKKLDDCIDESTILHEGNHFAFVKPESSFMTEDDISQG
jgi:hypothetical protein